MGLITCFNIIDQINHSFLTVEASGLSQKEPAPEPAIEFQVSDHSTIYRLHDLVHIHAYICTAQSHVNLKRRNHGRIRAEYRAFDDFQRKG